MPNQERDFTYEPPPPPLPTFSYDSIHVTESGRNYQDNHFVQFLKSIYGPEKTAEAVKRFLIGTSDIWTGATVFWQITPDRAVRHGKVMLYDPDTGKRSKNHFTTIAKEKGLSTVGHKLRQCLFGLHQLPEIPSNKIVIVEAEKTAIIASMELPEYTWMATGGKGNFNLNMLKPIKNYEIIAFPDMDGIEAWEETANRLNNYGFKIKINKMITQMTTDKNADLADVFLSLRRQLNEKDKQLTEKDRIIEKLIQMNPAMHMLIDTFGLE